MPSVIAYGCDDATTQFHPLQIGVIGHCVLLEG